MKGETRERTPDPRGLCDPQSVREIGRRRRVVHTKIFRDRVSTGRLWFRMGKFHRLIRFFKDKLDRCVWDLIVKNEQPREIRRDGASAAATAASSATNVASSWKQGGSKTGFHSLHEHDKTAVVAVARATCARVAGSRRFNE